MDPVIHVALPLLFLLAMRVETRMAILLAPLAIFPDFDVITGLHRVAFHNFIVTLVLPAAMIIYSWRKRPQWLPWALVAQFYLASHIVLDLSGVSFMWPMTTDQIYLEPRITLDLEGGINLAFHLGFGIRPYSPGFFADVLSGQGFALIFLAILVTVIFRKEAFSLLRRAWEIVVSLFVRK